MPSFRIVETTLEDHTDEVIQDRKNGVPYEEIIEKYRNMGMSKNSIVKAMKWIRPDKEGSPKSIIEANGGMRLIKMLKLAGYSASNIDRYFNIREGAVAQYCYHEGKRWSKFPGEVRTTQGIPSKGLVETLKSEIFKED